jgi:exopolysaccharide biosynthesis polyprenyl glycosylphosphotransferase
MAEAGVIGRINGRYLHIAEAVALAAPAVLLVPLSRSAVLDVVHRRRQWAPRVIIVGSGRLVDSIVGRLRRSGDAVLVGVVDGDGVGPGLLGGLFNLPELCGLHDVDRVLIIPSSGGPNSVLEAVQRLNPSVAVSLIPEFYELLNFRSTVEEMAGLPLVHVKPAKLSAPARATKRLFDIVASLFLMVLLTPLWVVLAIIIKRDSPGPVMFRQERPGLRRRPFPIIKFRTMSVDAEARRQEVDPLNEHADTPLFKARNDPRVTRVGRYLRQRHLDELPQLVNVLLGHMSLVGPRPFPTEESDSLSPRRFEVRPGMTGLWQVSGRIDLSHEDLLYLDAIYVGSWSFWWDMRILLQTPKVLIDRAGDGSGRRAEADEFKIKSAVEPTTDRHRPETTLAPGSAVGEL